MVLVLMSGGVDSTLLAERSHKNGTLSAVLFIDHGQPAASMERDAVNRWANRRNVLVIRQNILIFGTSLYMRTGAGEPGLRILPVRNLIFVAHAVNIAQTRRFREVWIGANADDSRMYPDCAQEWIQSLDALISAETGVRLVAPLINMRKSDVVAEARRMGLSLGEMWSCYEPIGSKPCGRCRSCMERRNASQEAEVDK